MNAQPELRLTLSERVKLVPLDTAGSALGLHADEAVRRSQGGKDGWPWCFDLAVGHHASETITGRDNPALPLAASSPARREVRVWLTCLQKPEDAAAATLSEVIDDIIGSALEEVRGASLEIRWRVSDRTLKRLVLSREVMGRVNQRTLWLHRGSLVNFLARRRVS